MINQSTNSLGQKIIKNASALMASQVITWLLALVYTIFLPRYLGAEAMGKFYLANSLWTMVGIFAIFGMDTLIIKVVARSPEKAPDLFGATLFLRVILFAVGTLAVAAYAYVAGYPADTRLIITIIGVANFVTLFTFACESIIKGMERMEVISVANIISRVVQVGLTMLMIVLRRDMYVIAAVGSLAALAHMLFVFIYLRRITVINLRFDFSKVRWMFQESLSYLLLRLALVFYQQADVIIISLLVNEQNIGWYGAADQLFGTFLFVPTVFITVLYPVLARMYEQKPDSVTRIMRKSFDMMWLIAVPMGLGVLVVGSPLTVALYGPSFDGAGPVLAVLGLVTIVTYQNMLLGQFLISTDRQKSWSWVILAAALITIPLDILLVPLCQRLFGIGALGGSFSFLITETGMTIAALAMLPKGTFTLQNLWSFLRILAAGLIMVVVAWWVRDMFIAVPILLGGFVYLAAVILFRAVPQEDWLLLRSTASAFTNKIRQRAAQPANAK